MFRKLFCLLFLLCFVVRRYLCYDPKFQALPAATPARKMVRCAEIPNSIYRCLSSPRIVKHGVSTKSCDNISSECERVRCIFTSSGWIQDSFFNKTAMSAHFTAFAHEKPDWSQAVDIIKGRCLQSVLLPQGIHMECPEFDVMHCTLAAFIRNSKASQWSSSSECEAARSYATACPVCPTACFAPTIPAGSCNACMDWPQL